MNHDELANLIARRSRRNETLAESREPLRAQLAEDVAAYLARGGRIDTSPGTALRVERREVSGKWALRYAIPPAPMNDIERIRAVHARRKTAGQRIVLQGSHTGPRP